jgi:hypothetical protein
MAMFRVGTLVSVSDHENVDPEEEARWQAARSLPELGELTARQLERRLAGTSHQDVLGLVPVLAACNRAGFVTDGAQPATPLTVDAQGHTRIQRAAVSGFAAEPVMAALYRAIEGTGLVVMASQPGQPSAAGRDALPVSAADEQPCRWFGAARTSAELASHYDSWHPDAVAALGAAWQVAIIDLKWGRNDVLWGALGRFAQAQGRERS